MPTTGFFTVTNVRKSNELVASGHIRVLSQRQWQVERNVHPLDCWWERTTPDMTHSDVYKELRVNKFFNVGESFCGILAGTYDDISINLLWQIARK